MSETETLTDVVNDIELRLPGWQWLVRKDFNKGYMANLLTPDFRMEFQAKGGVGRSTSHGKAYPATGKTPVAALRAALAKIDPIFFEEQR